MASKILREKAHKSAHAMSGPHNKFFKNPQMSTLENLHKSAYLNKLSILFLNIHIICICSQNYQFIKFPYILLPIYSPFFYAYESICQLNTLN